jgi:RND family efflux transporter MFP subunit
MREPSLAFLRPNLTGRLQPSWFIGATLLSGLFFLLACSKENAIPVSATSTPIPVPVLRMEAQPLDVTLEVTGPLVSSVAVDVKTEFAGRVASLLKREGDRVNRGELLAQLDDANARLSVSQAQANLGVAQATVGRGKVAEDHAHNELERAQKLLESGGITDRDFQAAQMASRDARAQVKLAEAQVDQTRQAVAIAEKHLSDCRIVSPISGEIERKVFNAGSWVDAAAVLYRLVDNQRLELQNFVASSDIARVKTGQRVRFNVAAYSGEEFDARIITLSAAVDSQNRSVLVRASVANPSGKLRAGMFAKGHLVTGTTPRALVVPPNALWRRAGQPPSLFIVEQNRARRREVKTGLEQPQKIEITGGLSPGDVVITEQKLELADGIVVTPQY